VSVTTVPAPARQARRTGRARRWLVRSLVVLAGLVLLLAIGLGLLLLLTPSVANAPRLVAERLAAAGAPALHRLPVPDRVGESVLATEDSRFYEDPGIDPIGLLRAALGPLRGPGDWGGAGIDQQLAKMLYTPHGGWLAKLEDVGLALKIDHDYSKSTILVMYLNTAYYGHGYYGVVAASRGYFGVRPSGLTWGQAALIAGLVQAPSAFDPTLHYHFARAKELHVLHRLTATGVLTAARARAAFRQPLHPAIAFHG
jgi:membrane peptidoglycan carboxypeptidase